jgi:hypothetical protein
VAARAQSLTEVADIRTGDRLALTQRQSHLTDLRPDTRLTAPTRRFAGILKRGNEQGYAGIFRESTRVWIGASRLDYTATDDAQAKDPRLGARQCTPFRSSCV